ncbi:MULTISPECIES: sterol desaturase family protein [Pseudomonas]|uniref:Sterol desaturase family protein n=1 Tax=Pseudomonas lactis TaxID=1615674 RepID=A0A921T9T5_9PSED|nr:MULTISPECIES: sterol desaturase family protein [Pseudomonas]MBK3433127.1 sterol desaturase family protein [Pseudomonas fluorescens]MBA1203561.1 sterol desaturase family protein [Pseudomonas capeferrum]MBK3483722.1 sterol desaturase family protein [Pseudomonas fluorescens]MEB0194439.1 sterol desaturase family protein [Pseudomonas sp. CCI1.1]OEC62222.1 sterol desaturase [Pseudomonas sp. AP19]
MPISLRFALRWLSYPLVFGGSTAFMVWALYAGVPYWPTKPLVAAVGLLAVAGLERVQPFREGWLHDHQDTLTDLVHMLVNLSVIQFTAEILARLGDAVPAAVRLFPVESPLWLQLLLVAAVLDLSLYGMHRVSHHVPWLWRFHMIHHSAERLYWMNGQRRHPLHAALMAGPGLVVLFASGAPSVVVATWFGILTVHLAFQHSNLDYRVGWLRYVLGVAEIHRWHHKRDFEDAQVNFGEFLMVWDRIFGTFYDSTGTLGDANVGLRERDYPKGYLGQLAEPFGRGRART